MTCRYIALLSIILSAGISHAGDLESDVKSMCAEQWGSDYSMQQFCRDKQFKAAGKLNDLMKANQGNQVFDGILSDCYRNWLDAKGRADYGMIVFCTEKQINAYRSLH